MLLRTLQLNVWQGIHKR